MEDFDAFMREERRELFKFLGHLYGVIFAMWAVFFVGLYAAWRVFGCPI